MAVLTVTNVAPAQGPTAGGTVVVITGANFTGVTSVLFGTTSASFAVNTPTQITALAPAHAAGTVDIEVANADGTSAPTGADQYLYAAAIPTVTGLSPSQGSTSGGTVVTISGTNFTGASSVTFGGVAAQFAVNSPTQITAFSPAHVAGSVDVRVTSPDGTSVAVVADQYLYVASIPTVTNVSPTQGPVAGGTVVTITGTNFTGATGVTFGGVAAQFGVNSSTQITALAPPHAAGQVAIVVSNADGSSNPTVASNYTYV